MRGNVGSRDRYTGEFHASRPLARRAARGKRSLRHLLPPQPRDARSAPSRIAFSFGHTIQAATHSRPANVPKPQSVDAMTRSRSPIAATASSMRRATTSGCSTKFVVDSITPGIRIYVLRERIGANAAYSCWWRGLANSIVARRRSSDRTPAASAPARCRRRAGLPSCPSRCAAGSGRAECPRCALLIAARCISDDLDEPRPSVLERHRAFHREIGRIDLQDQPGLVDGADTPCASRAPAPSGRPRASRSARSSSWSRRCRAKARS